MGAIYGVLGASSPSDLERMGARLAHRGRGTRTWSPGERVRFGQRLSGQDAAAVVPVPVPIIALDGFIDNTGELASLLGKPAAAAGLLGDAAFMHELYKTFGPAGLAYASGQFALAIWDAPRDRLVLARDAWGIRPLYHASVRGRDLFASEYKALLALDDVPAEPDREAIQHLLCARSVPSDASCLAHVRPVPPGSWLELDGRGTCGGGDYRRLSVRAVNRSERAQEIVLRSRLCAAVERQTNRHERIGVALSAGIDSAVVLALAHKAAAGRPIHTFTAGFGRDDPDLRQAATLARHYGTEHHEVLLAPADLFGLVPEALWRMEDPIGREEIIFYLLLVREASRHVPVLLTGHQSDALFGGMPRHLLVKIAADLPSLLRRPLAEFLNYTQVGTEPRSLAGRGLVAAYYRGTRLPPPRVLGTSAMPVGVDLGRERAEPLNTYLCSSLLHGSNALATIERLHSGHNVDMTSPFFDTRLVEAAFEMPDGCKIRGRRQKRILYNAARDLIPPGLLPRKKGLLRLKHDEAFAQALDGLADDLLSDAVVRRRGLIDPAYVARVRRRDSSGSYPTDQAYRLWSLLLLERWLRIYVDDRGARPIAIGERSGIAPPAGSRPEGINPRPTRLEDRPRRAVHG